MSAADRPTPENNGTLTSKMQDFQYSTENNECVQSLLSNSEKIEQQSQSPTSKLGYKECDAKLTSKEEKLEKRGKLSRPCGPNNNVLLRLSSSFLCVLVLWGLLYALIPKEVQPGGKLFTLLILLLSSYVGGEIFKLLGLPKLLGMLLIGILMRNTGFYFKSGVPDTYTTVVSVTRQVALTNILITAGLELNAKAMKRLSLVVLELSFIPCIIEAIAVAGFCRLILDFPWPWGMLVGCVMGAVSPAIVVPALLHLQKQGFDADHKISTIVIAAASFDDLVAISGYGIFFGMIFSEGDVVQNAIHGPTELFIGLLLGIIWGVVAAWIPHPADNHLVAKRVFIVGGGGLMFGFGGKYIGYEGAGPLACIVAAFTARICWNWQGWSTDYNPVKNVFASLWIVLEPALFGLIGAEIDLRIVQVSEVVNATLVIAGGLLARGLACSMVLSMVDVTFKELIFINVAWIPKATVQAALGPLAYDRTTLGTPRTAENIERGQLTMMIAVLSILLTAPLGAIGIKFLGPRLMQKSSSNTSNTRNQNAGSADQKYSASPITEA